MLDFSILKSKEYQDKIANDMEDIKVFAKMDLFGEDFLTKDEYKRYMRLMEREINEKNPALSNLDKLILK